MVQQPYCQFTSLHSYVAAFCAHPCGEFCGWYCPCAVSRSTTICPNSELSRVKSHVELRDEPANLPTAYAIAGRRLSVRTGTLGSKKWTS